MVCRQPHELLAHVQEERIGADDERAEALLRDDGESTSMRARSVALRLLRNPTIGVVEGCARATNGRAARLAPAVARNRRREVIE